VSKFIKRGAKVINASAYTDDLDYCAFKNPDGQVVLVVLNRGDKNRSLIVRLDGHIYRTEMSAHSIATFIINK
jgi:glucosylceramidase